MTESITAKANTGSGTETLAVDAVGALLIPIAKIWTGASNVDGGPVTSANPFHVAPNITRGLGNVDSNTTRVTIASDGPAVTALTSIDAKTPALVSGAQPVAPNITRGLGVVDANTTRVTLASDGPAVTALVAIDADIGAPADAAASTDTGTFSLIALTKRLLTKVPVFGQAVMASSLPVTIASNQSAVPVSLPNMVVSSYNVAGVITINTDLLVIDCTGLEAVSIQCISMGTTGVVTPAWSNDITNYQAATILTQAGATATTFNAAGLWTTPVLARYLRLRLTTATTAGTTTLSVQGITQAANVPVAAQPVSGSVTVSGTVTATVGTSITGGAIAPLTLAGVTIETSAARTITANGTTITNASGRGAMFFINVTVATGTTPTLVAQLQVQDPVSTSFIDVVGAVTPTITATGLSILTVAPGISETANLKVSHGLPRVYRFRWTIGGTTPSFTFSIGAQYLL